MKSITKTKPRGGKSNRQKAELQRVFNGLPVVDAKKPLRFFANGHDVRGAVPKDPHNCVVARACKRLFEGQSIVWRSVAYVEVARDDGKRVVERFMLPPAARRDIAVLDATGKASPNGYTLAPPSRSATLDVHSSYQREWSAQNKRGRGHKPPISISSEVRDGTGAVHFSRVAKNNRSWK